MRECGEATEIAGDSTLIERNYFCDCGLHIIMHRWIRFRKWQEQRPNTGVSPLRFAPIGMTYVLVRSKILKIVRMDYWSSVGASDFGSGWLVSGRLVSDWPV